jgi:hypothetical protein
MTEQDYCCKKPDEEGEKLKELGMGEYSRLF